MQSNSRKWALSLASLVLLMAAPALAHIGIASTVEGAPLDLPTSGTERVLVVGVDLDANDKVTTKDNDRAHLVFDDGTSLTIGPNSAITIDKYVFDPNKKTGDMALKLERGTMRFVGGAISKSSVVKIDTPSATVGIRGGIITVQIAPNGTVTVNFLSGATLTVTSQGVTRTSHTPGTTCSTSPGSAPTPPSAIQRGALIALSGSLSRSSPALGGTARSVGAQIRGALSGSAFSNGNGKQGPGAFPGTPADKQAGALLSSVLALTGGNSGTAALAVATLMTSVQSNPALLTALSTALATAANNNPALAPFVAAVAALSANNPVVVTALSNAAKATGNTILAQAISNPGSNPALTPVVSPVIVLPPPNQVVPANGSPS